MAASRSPLCRPPQRRCVPREPKGGGRSVSGLSWHPDDRHKLAAAYSCLDFQKASGPACPESYVWDVGERIGRGPASDAGPALTHRCFLS